MQSHHSANTAGNVTMSTLNSQSQAGPSHHRQRSRKQSSGGMKAGQQPGPHDLYQQQRSSQSQSVNRMGARHHHQSHYDIQKKTAQEKDKALMSGTLSGMSCTNLSQHEGLNNNRADSSFNELTKNKSSISLNHYLSHNAKDFADHSQL